MTLPFSGWSPNASDDGGALAASSAFEASGGAGVTPCAGAWAWATASNGAAAPPPAGVRCPSTLAEITNTTAAAIAATIARVRMVSGRATLVPLRTQMPAYHS